MGRLPLHFTEEDVAGLVRRFEIYLLIREKGTTRSKGSGLLFKLVHLECAWQRLN